VVPGVNRVFAHDGREYHLQVEDLGSEQAALEARVFDQGTLLWRRRVGYAEILAQKLARAEQEDALRALMEKTLQTLQAAIAKGKLA
jgi:hypothetical protein